MPRSGPRRSTRSTLSCSRIADGVRREPRRHQLDAERQTVDTLANLDQRVSVGAARVERRIGGAGPHGEQLDCVLVRQRVDGNHDLVNEVEGLTARSQDVHAGAPAQDGVDEALAASSMRCSQLST